MKLPWTCKSCGKQNYHYAPCWCGATREPHDIVDRLRANADLKQYAYTRAPRLFREAADAITAQRAELARIKQQVTDALGPFVVGDDSSEATRAICALHKALSGPSST